MSKLLNIVSLVTGTNKSLCLLNISFFLVSHTLKNSLHFIFRYNNLIFVDRISHERNKLVNVQYKISVILKVIMINIFFLLYFLKLQYFNLSVIFNNVFLLK